jgi:glyoxylase-like metal-dependent hydrolase (beta-lactamase superfamily II)
MEWVSSFYIEHMQDHQFGHIRFIGGENHGRYPFCNSLYVEGAHLLIDPASDRKKLLHLKDSDRVEMVWLSHWHEDHFTYLGMFDDCPFLISERDIPPLTDIDVLLDWYGMDSASHRTYWKESIIENFNYRPRQAAHFLKDGEIINIGPVTVEVIATPGHTPGHLAFFFREEELLFMGDYDLTSFGPWYGDLYSSIEETITSIRRLQEIPAKIWITGHDNRSFTDNPGILWKQYENIIFARENKLLDFLKHPHTLDEIVSAWLIYGKPRDPLDYFEFCERALVKKHLRYLEKQAKIIFEDNIYIRN